MGKDLLNNCISRFSIRKLNVAVCSVLLGTLVMLGTDNKVLTDELTTEVQTVPLHQALQELKLKLLNLQIMVVELINRWIHQVKHQKPRIMNHLSHLKPP